jgi:hypothetical protein
MKALAIFAILGAGSVLAQQPTLNCNDSNYGGRRAHQCEMRELPAAFAGRLAVDAGHNGGIRIQGWDQGTVLVRAKVDASAPDQATAQNLVSQVRIDVSAGQVSASGAAPAQDQSWAVSYEIFVPRNGDLSLTAHNGGIHITDVRGNIKFNTVNGGVSLTRLAGDVEGATKNGGLKVELAGNRWDGTKLDARKTNGGVQIAMPQTYSAHFESSTVNGGMDINVPMTVTGKISRSISTDLGGGGPTIHVETTNGGIHVNRSAM